MRVFLLFLSNIIALCWFGISAREADSGVSRPTPLQRHTFRIETSGGAVSGILLASADSEYINGSMINEFGVSAIDFTYSTKKRKVKLVNVISFLNKWYIRMVLKNDIKYCLHVLFDTPYDKDGRNYDIIRSADTVTVINQKRHIKYSFSPLTIPTDKDDTQQ